MHTHKLAQRIRELFLDGHWISGSNVQELLADIHLEQANTQVADLNTLARLTFHLNYYLEGLNHFFQQGELTISDKQSFNMPAIDSTEKWEALRGRLLDNAKTLADLVATLADEDLDKVFVKADYGDYRRNINGLLEHSYYHFGQMALIKKLVLSPL